MFYDDGIICRSSLLDIPGICHGFSTRLGGVSTHPYTSEMNLAFGREDSDEIVRENHSIFAGAVSGGVLGACDVVAAPQIHSADVRVVGMDARGEGVTRDAASKLDGFVTASPGVMLLVRVADCVPILLVGQRDGEPVVAALHAGWRGTAAGIVLSGLREMEKLGCTADTVKAAVGAHIGVCCFEVGEDMRDAVADLRGRDFTRRHIKETDGKLHADLTGMNRELLLESGVLPNNIDVSPECTCCRGDKYHSHRRTGGKRGGMGAAVAILP